MDKQDKLENYSKQEIIEAIRRAQKYYDVHKDLEKSLIDNIQDNNRQKAFEKAQAKRKTAIDRMNEYFDFRNEMVKKYGDGKKVNLLDIPHTERQRLLNLHIAWSESEEERKKAEKQEDKYYG